MNIPAQLQTVNSKETQIKITPPPNYDQIIQLINAIESDELEKNCSLEELEKITQYISFLAREGVLLDGSEESLSLEDDIEKLLNSEKSLYEYAFYHGSSSNDLFDSSDFYSSADTFLCKSWVQKQWKHTKKFVKKHKKAIIIGTAVVVAGAAVIVAVVAASSVAAGTAAASAAGVAGASTSSSSEKSEDKPLEKKSSSISEDIQIPMTVAEESSTLKSAIANQTASFKENILEQQFFHPIEFKDHPQELSWEEEGRALGSFFAHDSLNHLRDQISSDPKFAQEVQEMELKYFFVMPRWNNNDSMGHTEIDQMFSTDYSYLYASSSLGTDFNTLFYQAHGEAALKQGYLTQAVENLGKAIELNPSNPIPYLERGMAHFGLGEYDHFLEDYQEFSSQAQKNYPLVVTDFSLGFTKGLPRGIYDSGEGIFLFISDLVRHPIHTGEQMFEVLTFLTNLALTEQWDSLSEVLAPEVRQLIKEWNTIPSGERGELAGYAFGKYGSDIVIPGALTKVLSKGMKGALELSQVYKSLQTAEKTLLLESIAGLENGANIEKVVRSSQTTIALGEELGYSAHEMTRLKQIGQLEKVLAKSSEYIFKNSAKQESLAMHENAKTFLKPYIKKPMPEETIRGYIREAGITTFPRPKGVPENFLVKISDRGAGMEYVHPTNTQISVRVMPGKPHSPLPHQQKPYVIHKKEGKAFDKYGNFVEQKALEAHIPIEEFIYRE